jgi:hypothetical protein
MTVGDAASEMTVTVEASMIQQANATVQEETTASTSKFVSTLAHSKEVSKWLFTVEQPWRLCSS